MLETLGLIFSSFDIRDYKATAAIPKNGFAKEFELKIPRVKAQGNVGSCGAHVLSCIVEYFNYIQHGLKTEMSVGYIYGNREKTTHKGKGLILRDALATLRVYGDVTKADFPYNMPIHEAWAVVDNIKDGVVLKKPLSSSTSKQMANVINAFGNIAKQIDSKVDVKTLSKRINSKINNVAKKILSQ